MRTPTFIFGALAARRLPDESLFGRAIRGDAVAFSEVYRRYERRVYGFCLARSLDREAAADATQEVFIRLLNADADSVTHPRAWLFAVARNLVIDSMRKKTQLRESGELAEDAPAWRALSAADTADEVTARADADAAFLALRRMKPRYRTALILREMHGQSSADIAEAIGATTTGAVDTLLCRARDAFGVAYASVLELPQACRHNVELMYRSHGSGVSAAEGVAHQTHLASCDHCRREATRASDSKHLAALLPLLVPAGDAAHSVLGRAALAGGEQPAISVAQHVAQFFQTHLQTVGSQVVAGSLVASLIAVPVVAVRDIPHDPLPRVVSAVARAKATPVGSAQHAANPKQGTGSPRAAFAGSPWAHGRAARMARTTRGRARRAGTRRLHPPRSGSTRVAASPTRRANVSAKSGRASRAGSRGRGSAGRSAR